MQKVWILPKISRKRMLKLKKWTKFRFEFYIIKGTEPILELPKQTEMMQDMLVRFRQY